MGYLGDGTREILIPDESLSRFAQTHKATATKKRQIGKKKTNLDEP